MARLPIAADRQWHNRLGRGRPPGRCQMHDPGEAVLFQEREDRPRHRQLKDGGAGMRALANGSNPPFAGQPAE
jgi:hypothetical protein